MVGPNEPTRQPNPNGNAAVNRASSAAHAAIDRVSSNAQPMLDSAHGMVDNLAESTARAAEAVGEQGARLKSVEAQAAESVRQYVRAKPITALGIAVGVSFVLARLLR